MTIWRWRHDRSPVPKWAIFARFRQGRPVHCQGPVRDIFGSQNSGASEPVADAPNFVRLRPDALAQIDIVVRCLPKDERVRARRLTSAFHRALPRCTRRD
jgi:hypothetical protein